MTNDDETTPEVPIAEWLFEHHGPHHWEELASGNIDKSRCWVQLTECEDGPKISIHVDRKEVASIRTYRDHWGTYISLMVGEGDDARGCTIAQEDGTTSFMHAFMSALSEIKAITDIGTKAAERTALNPQESTA